MCPLLLIGEGLRRASIVSLDMRSARFCAADGKFAFFVDFCKRTVVLVFR